MHLLTNKLLTSSVIIWLILIFYSLFLLPHTPFELSSETIKTYLIHTERMFLLNWITTITCGINISGMIVGFFELRKDLKASLIGLGGNLLMIIIYLVLMVYRDFWVELVKFL